MLKNFFIKRFGLELLLLLLLSLTFWLNKQTFELHFEDYQYQFQRTFTDKVEKLDRLLLYETHRYEHFGFEDIWEHKVDENFNLHIYRNDSLKFWSSNELPILRFAEIHFPADGIVHLQNGWYYAKTIREGRVVFCASFLIKKDYSYQNKELSNEFANDFSLPFKAKLSLEEGPFNIRDEEGAFVFAVEKLQNQPISLTANTLFLFCFLGIFILSVLLIDKWIRRGKRPVFAFLAFALVFVWRVFVEFNFPYDHLANLDMFQASLFGLNEFFPNYFSYLLSITVLVYGINLVSLYIKEKNTTLWERRAYLLLFFGFFAFWNLVLFFAQALVENSTIPMQIDQIFDLNAYSVLGFVSISVLVFSYFRILRKVALVFRAFPSFQSTLFVLIFLGGVGYIIYDVNYGVQNFIASVFPGLFLAVLVLFYREGERKNEFIYGIVFLFLVTIVLSTIYGVYNQNKENSDRELYANQLQTDQNILTELEFEKIGAAIDQDEFFKKLLNQRQNIGLSDFHDAIERRIFKGIWEQYEMDFFLFTADSVPYLNNFGLTRSQLEEVILKHGKQSEINPEVFFIEDYVEQFTYVFRYPLKQKEGAFFYAALKSKRIPEEIGFPRLLISEKAQVFQSLENYSVAKYFNGKLITKYGTYQYPVLLRSFKIGPEYSEGYLERGNYNHYFLKSGDKNYIFLSVKEPSLIDLLTRFSYLFCFQGLLLLHLLFRRRTNENERYQFTMAMKIQLVMIALVFFALLIYGWGSGAFVSNQYNDYTNDVISEKLNSVRMEFQSRFRNFDFEENAQQGSEVESALQKFSKVFVTDINYYDENGYLFASSRPRVFNVGLLSEQMNPSAMTAMKLRNESEYVHQEKIGSLTYASAYQPYFNEKGELLGYLNLQHFGQQKDFEIQIQRFLMAIVNVFMFLLAISAVVAILVSGWLTAPLRVLQESLSQVNFGQLNEPISYQKDDEIGALVREYNQKIDELALKAQQLAQSERENAWREMAKQVAHEIKNPLTPMKLSLQHFQRLYDPNSPISKERFDNTVASLVEQIDGLTRIANDFSSFAKMPNPNEVEIDLGNLIQGVVEVFSQSDVAIHLNVPEEPIKMLADKDMLVRIFNNLVKNAIQALHGANHPRIDIDVEEGADIRIGVRDNGPGMGDEVQRNLFKPYFTTKSTGTGLGLAMVKQMVELHKGKIEFESKLGEGTLFVIVFPNH
ncbi:MAG: ATP-binding protein [Crocinitomicaceae bacterium]|jgi:signal transduction histidine kinase|nr:ATP-binding protein [Crocinitomicaceae bacterium]